MAQTIKMVAAMGAPVMSVRCARTADDGPAGGSPARSTRGVDDRFPNRPSSQTIRVLPETDRGQRSRRKLPPGQPTRSEWIAYTNDGPVCRGRPSVRSSFRPAISLFDRDGRTDGRTVGPTD